MRRRWRDRKAPHTFPGWPRPGERRRFGKDVYILTSISTGWGLYDGHGGRVSMEYQYEREWLAGQMIPDERPRLVRWRAKCTVVARRRSPARSSTVWLSAMCTAVCLAVDAVGYAFGRWVFFHGPGAVTVFVVAVLAAIPVGVRLHWLAFGRTANK